MSLLKWTSKSTTKLAGELSRRGFTVSADTVGRLLKRLGYSLLSPAKVKEGTAHPDRDGQFRYLHGLAQEFVASGVGVDDLLHAIPKVLRSLESDTKGDGSGAVFKIERGASGEKIAFVRLRTSRCRASGRSMPSKTGAATSHRIAAGVALDHRVSRP